jgi:hypothetical protein
MLGSGSKQAPTLTVFPETARGAARPDLTALLVAKVILEGEWLGLDVLAHSRDPSEWSEFLDELVAIVTDVVAMKAAVSKQRRGLI